jgi:hypothetical protein
MLEYWGMKFGKCHFHKKEDNYRAQRTAAVLLEKLGPGAVQRLSIFEDDSDPRAREVMRSVLDSIQA